MPKNGANVSIDKILQKFDLRFSLGSTCKDFDYIELMKIMLEYHPRSRIEPAQLLKHNYL